MENQELLNNVRQYLLIKDEVKLLTTRESEIKSRLIAVVDEAEADERGHRVLTVVEPTTGDEVKLIRQRRVSKTLDMDIAEEILTKRGIKDTCIKMVPTLDEGAIMAAFQSNYLTEDDIDAMFPAKVSYAFLMQTES